MRHIVRPAGLIAFALILPPAAAAQSVPPGRAEEATAVQPIDPIVRIRLNDALGEDLAAVRAALLGLGSIRIAEPADYELTTLRDFPQTLVAIDAKQPEKQWATRFSVDPPERAPRMAELGNIVLGDYKDGLRVLAGRHGRARLLMLGGAAPAMGALETCLRPDGVDPRPENCHRGAMRPEPGGQRSPDHLDPHDERPVVRLTNRSTRPLFAALLLIDPTAGVTRIPFSDKAGAGPIPPGGSLDSDLLAFSTSIAGRHVLVTIASETPIDTAPFEQPTIDDPHWAMCGPDEANEPCPPPPDRVPADWTVTLAEYDLDAPVLVGLGGGMSVLDGMAPWMAEIYSTVPYEPKDFRDDAAKPPAERQFLAQRRPAELSHRCGATLIAPDLVLTAAHCVAKDRYAGAGMSLVFKERRVRIGSVRLGRGGSTLAIAGVAVPIDYVPGRQDNDIALLLVRPDRGTKSHRPPPIRLGQKPLVAESRLTAFGWGYTGAVAPDANPLFNVAEELQRNPDMLQFGQMKVLAWPACRRKLGNRLGPGMTCLVAPGATAGSGPVDNVFSCRGDSGGPLVRKVGNVEELVGVTSWSMGCGYKDFPSVYTDVTKYRRWIEAARGQLRPGAAIRVDEKAARSLPEARRQVN